MNKGQRETQVRKDRKESKVLKGSKGFQVNKVPREIQVRKDRKESKESRVSGDRKDCKGNEGLKEMPEFPANLPTSTSPMPAAPQVPGSH